MKVSLRWLKDYVEIDVPARELAEMLTMAGTEVESIEELGAGFSGVVAARILSVRPHPQADKLKLCEVDMGKEVVQVVCGAPNVAAGQVAPLATVGAEIPGGYIIKASTIRGEVSYGMLCSEQELGLGEDHSGIMVLPPDTPVGKDLGELLDLKDTVFDLAITPNRGDCLSVIGVAREIAALTGKKVRLPDWTVEEKGEAIEKVTSVTILDPDYCPRYCARIIRDVKIKPSPLWMRRRLEAAGLRAINNMVDVTNFVMLEMGQPLHAFDYRFLEEGRIVVRKAKAEEKFVSLDEKERRLKEGTLLICDGVKPVAIAGIMGGLNSEVKDDTSTILLESAYFHPPAIRRAARALGMSTDAAFRFERGVDPEGVVKALNRAAKLMAELGEGYVLKGYIDNYPLPVYTPKDIPLRLGRINGVLGTDIREGEVERILEALQMEVRKEPAGRSWRVTPPSYRRDIEREIDLIEEIARVYGYEHIGVTMPRPSDEPKGKGEEERLRNLLYPVLMGAGLSEVITYSFISANFPDQLHLQGEKEAREAVRLRNPLSEEQALMRTNMVYSLLDTLSKNARLGVGEVKIFEFGRVYFSRGEGKTPQEVPVCACLVWGDRVGDSWHFPKEQADFYDLKGVVENIFEVLKLPAPIFQAAAAKPFLHPGRAAWISCIGGEVGFIGEIHPDVMRAMDLRGRAVVCELNLSKLADLSREVRVSYRELSKYPGSVRDAAFVVPKEMEAASLLEIVFREKEELLERVLVFDVYEGQNIPPGTRSIGLRFYYRSPKRTLTDEEVARSHERLVNAIVREAKATLRA